MVFGLGKKKEMKIGQEFGSSNNPQYPSPPIGRKIAVGIGRGLKAYGKVVLQSYGITKKDPDVVKRQLEAKKEKVKTRLALVKEEYEIAKMQRTIKKLKQESRSTSSSVGIEILKKINVPDYIGSLGSSTASSHKQLKARKKQPWEII